MAISGGGAFKRIEDMGGAAIFVTLMIPGNERTQFHPVNSKMPASSLGYQDGLAMRDLIGGSRGGQAPQITLNLDVKMEPGLKTSTVWGTLPGMTDETATVLAYAATRRRIYAANVDHRAGSLSGCVGNGAVSGPDRSGTAEWRRA